VTHSHCTKLHRVTPNVPLQSDIDDHLDMEEHLSSHTSLLSGYPSAQVLQTFDSTEALLNPQPNHNRSAVNPSLMEEFALANVWAHPHVAYSFPLAHGISPEEGFQASGTSILSCSHKHRMYAYDSETELAAPDIAGDSGRTTPDPTNVWPMTQANFWAARASSPVSQQSTEGFPGSSNVPGVSTPKQGGHAKVHGRSVSWAKLEAMFHKPMQRAALELGMGTTTLKKLARSHGVSRWPYRSLTASARRASAASAKGMRGSRGRPTADAKDTTTKDDRGSVSDPRSYAPPRTRGMRVSSRLASEGRASQQKPREEGT